MTTAIAIYDVFAEAPFRGNPAAVVHDARPSFSDTQLLTLARELMLPETVVSAHRGHDLVLRFANADRLLPRCGHASLAAAADHIIARVLRHRMSQGVWNGRYRVGTVVADWCVQTLSSDIIEGETLGCDVAIAWPDRPRRVQSLPARSLYSALGLRLEDGVPGLPVSVYDSGNRNAMVPIRNIATLARAAPNWSRLKFLFEKHTLTDVHLYSLVRYKKSTRQVYARCRNVFPYGVFEETATGTASVALAAYLVDHLPVLQTSKDPIHFQFVQGGYDREGLVRVEWCPQSHDTPSIWLKGHVFPILHGRLIASV